MCGTGGRQANTLLFMIFSCCEGAVSIKVHVAGGLNDRPINFPDAVIPSPCSPSATTLSTGILVFMVPEAETIT